MLRIQFSSASHKKVIVRNSLYPNSFPLFVNGKLKWKNNKGWFFSFQTFCYFCATSTTNLFPNHHHIRCKYTHRDCLLNRKLCKPAKCGPMVGKFYLCLLHQRRGRMKQKVLDKRPISMEQKCTYTSHIFPKAQITLNQILQNYWGKRIFQVL